MLINKFGGSAFFYLERKRINYNFPLKLSTDCQIFSQTLTRYKLLPQTILLVTISSLNQLKPLC